MHRQALRLSISLSIICEYVLYIWVLLRLVFIE
nr:MAG TPA_asm: protein of unknown function DUF4924 [Bacteriophage sp.]